MSENAQLANSVEPIEQPAPRSEEGRHRSPGMMRLFPDKGQPSPGRSPLFRR